MPKTFPIHLEVEEIALGTVLRKLNDMPGIAKIDLNLGHGGQGAGKEKLVQGAAQMRGDNAEQAIVKLLVSQGEMHIQEIASTLGWAKQRAYGAMHQLRKKGITEAGSVKGTHRLTRKAAAHIHAAKAPAGTPALPAPAQVKHGPGGRAAPGSGNIVLKSILSEGPKTPAEVKVRAAELGVSPKSISGVIDRAKKGGFIKKNGAGYELTAKGLKIETGAAAHG
jgi:Mn-dependent DtxR family transcriptional regulator